MNLSNYSTEVLIMKAEHILNDYVAYKDALRCMPESSVLGTLSVSAMASVCAKKYRRYKAEILNREADKKSEMEQLERKYGCGDIG